MSKKEICKIRKYIFTNELKCVRIKEEEKGGESYAF